MELSYNKFKEESIGKLLMKFAVPSIISLLIIELYNMVDTVFAGRYVGETAIAAITIAFPIQKFLVSLAMLVAVGASTMVAVELGSNDKEKIERTIITAFTLIAVVLAIFIVLIYVFKNPIISALGASSKVAPVAGRYLSIALFGCVFQSISTVACYIMTSLGNTKVTLYANILGLFIAVIMEYVLVAVLNFGIDGAAISTAFSQFCAAIYAFSKLKKVSIRFKFKFIKLGLLKKIIAIGFTSFVIEMSDACIAVILNELLAAKGGDTAIIIVGVITKISMFIYVTIIGISAAMQPIIAYNYGAGDYRKMQEALKLTIKAVFISSVLSGSILMLFAKAIIGFFIKDAFILNEAVNAFRISIGIYPFMGLYYVCIYYYQSVNESVKSFFLSIYGHIILFILVLFILVNAFGIIGAWLTYPVSETIAFITSIWLIRDEIAGERNNSTLFSFNKHKYGYSKI